MNINFKLVSRNILRDKSQALLNIIGLTIAFSGVFAIAGWVKNELSYDKHLPNSERVYRLTFETTFFGGNTLHFARCNEPWVSAIPRVFPQVEELVRLESYRHTALKINENKFYSERVFATDSNFFKVFGINLLSGDQNTVLNRPNTAVISASLAYKCFGNINPLGQTIFMSGEYDTKSNPFTVSGVMQDSMANSHIHFDILTSFANPQDPPGWAYVYLLLKKNSRPEDILSGLPKFINDSEKADVQKFYKPYLQKVTDIHLHSNKDRELEINGNITSIYLFVAIAIVLLAVTLINYFNLNKARLFYMEKQIRIQGISGSGKSVIFLQSIFESGSSVLIALLVSLNLLDLINIITHEGKITLGGIWPIIALVTLLAIFTGSLPIFIYLLKGNGAIKIHGKKNLSGFSSYGLLLTVQFCMSVVLLIATITIYFQKEFIYAGTMGQMSSDILVFKKQNWEIRGKYDTFKSEVMKNPLIKSVTAAMEEPGGETLDALQFESPDLDSDHRDIPLFVLSVDDNFLDFFNLSLIAGRSFSKYDPNRKGEDYILNEKAVKKLGWTPEEAIGRKFRIKFDTPDIFYGGNIVGVVRDFTYTSVKQEIKPYVLFQKPIFYLTFMVSIQHNRKDEAIASLKKIWDKELPDYPFQYELIEDLYNNTYNKEISQSKLTVLFSLLSIIIICLGLYSITSLLIARRTKEIGLRKVNGGRISDILMMLNANFIKWLLFAFIIACPVAWFTMHKWLESFIYKTEIKLWVFIISGTAILIVTLLTVSLHSLKAARKNPVEALRYE